MEDSYEYSLSTRYDWLAFVETLEEFELTGPTRHLMFELYTDSLGSVEEDRAWAWHYSRNGYADRHVSHALGIDLAATEKLLASAAERGLVRCSQSMKDRQIHSIGLGEQFLDALREREQRISDLRARARSTQPKTPKPATAGDQLAAHLLFDSTCEICGEKAAQGLDQRGRKMCASRIRKAERATADNLTLLCSRCVREHKRVNLPAECRSVMNMRVALERGYEPAPRTAKPMNKPPQEITVIATGLVSIKTKNVETAPEADSAK